MNVPTLSGHNKPRQTLPKCDILALDVDRNTTLKIDTSRKDNNCRMIEDYEKVFVECLRFYKREDIHFSNYNKLEHNEYLKRIYDEYFKKFMSYEMYETIIKARRNRRNKRYRTNLKIKDMILLKQYYNAKHIVFGTLTLDEHNYNLKENTYIRKIHKWLKKHFYYVILNKDYGAKKGREHYHFIGITSEDLEEQKKASGEPKKSKKGYTIYELKNKDYDIGFEPTLTKVKLKDTNVTVNYLLKLNNHSNKETTKSRIRIIKCDDTKYVKIEKKKKRNVSGQKEENKDQKLYEKIREETWNYYNDFE